jgi:hypothetical protein
MDTNIIILLNFILQILALLDHSIFQRLRRSECFGASISLNDIENNQTKKDNLTIDINNKI